MRTMEEAHEDFRIYLAQRFREIPYHAIQHNLTDYADIDGEIREEWKVYVSNYDWHSGKTLPEAINNFDRGSFPRRDTCGCIGVGV